MKDSGNLSITHVRNIKLTIEYDGTDFCGWQRQPRVRTVQEELERSLKELFQENIQLIGSGRTDAGVHALGQVANFCTEKMIPIDGILKGTNTILDRDVRIIKAEKVHSDFHARYDAKSRSYRYVISKRPVAVGRQFVWFIDDILNVQRMQEGSEYLLGEHDFSSFCPAKTKDNHFLSRVDIVKWCESDGQIILDITANRFLHNMVRIIVGTMVEIGRYKKNPDDIEKILLKKQRIASGMTAPACGLFLVKVDY